MHLVFTVKPVLNVQISKVCENKHINESEEEKERKINQTKWLMTELGQILEVLKMGVHETKQICAWKVH